MRPFVLFTFLVTGCSFGESTQDASLPDVPRRDAGARDADLTDTGPTGPRVEVGTGSLMFELLEEGAVVPIESGPQGGGRFEGFHVWFGARIHALEPEQISSTFSVLSTQRDVIAELTWTTNYRASAMSDAYEIWGATPRITDCCLAVNAPLIMRVSVMDTNGQSAASEVQVVGGDRCEDFTGNLCP